MSVAVIAILSAVGVLVFLAGIIALIIVLSKTESGKRESRIERQGRIGEEYVHNILVQAIAGTEAKLISDYMFEGQGRSVQIDHILISKSGVYVIETKNWSGNIYGNETDNKWIQILGNGNIRHEKENPVRQNEYHIYQLKKMLWQGITYHNAVIFAKGNNSDIVSDKVYSPPEFVYKIRQPHKQELNERQIENIFEILQKRNISGQKSNEEHVSEIKSWHKAVDNNICPYCGVKLTLREGKYGKFYGCPNYPECTFKKQI